MKAFPNHRSEGMDLRDYFAAKAVQSLWVLGPKEFEKRAKKENGKSQQHHHGPQRNWVWKTSPKQIQTQPKGYGHGCKVNKRSNNKQHILYSTRIFLILS